MGDLCDVNDCDRFLRSATGKTYLNEITAMLKGRTVVDVSFTNEVHCIATRLHLDDNTDFEIWQPSLDVDALREQFGDVLDEEYYADYPNRRPAAEYRIDTEAGVPCTECGGRGWLIMLNADTVALELQRCDSCCRFSSDMDARNSVAANESTLATVLCAFCKAVAAEAGRIAEKPTQGETQSTSRMMLIRDSLRNALALRKRSMNDGSVLRSGAFEGDSP